MGVPPADLTGWTGGWVRRWSASAMDPLNMHASATISPAYGLTMVASTVTSAGPVTKITSSATDSKAKAVCSLAEPPCRWDQRARTIEPSESEVAPTSSPAA